MSNQEQHHGKKTNSAETKVVRLLLFVLLPLAVTRATCIPHFVIPALPISFYCPHLTSTWKSSPATTDPGELAKSTFPKGATLTAQLYPWKKVFSLTARARYLNIIN